MKTPDTLFLLTVISIVASQLILGYRTSRLYEIANIQANINNDLVDLTKSLVRRIDKHLESDEMKKTVLTCPAIDCDMCNGIVPAVLVPDGYWNKRHWTGSGYVDLIEQDANDEFIPYKRDPNVGMMTTWEDHTNEWGIVWLDETETNKYFKAINQ